MADKKRSGPEEEGTADCSICLQPWAANGDHRIAVLRCGHLFGKDCIERWIKERKSCPSCSDRAQSKDIRLLFVPQVLMLRLID